jgi:hypothetical protein
MLYGYCHHWAFLFEDEQYAVTLLSRSHSVMVVRRFLDDAKASLTVQTPEERLALIWGALREWTFDPSTGSIAVAGLSGTFTSVPTASQVTFSDFDPVASLGGGADYGLIWRALIGNAGVLIVGPSPDLVSSAVFGVISLVAPLEYHEPVLVYTRLGDPRFAEVINGVAFWKIVGTTNILAVERCKQFKVVLRLGTDAYRSH